MNRKLFITVIVVLSLCIVLALVGVGIVLTQPRLLLAIVPNVTRTPQRFPTNVPATLAPLPATPLASVPNDTANALANTAIPFRDLYQIVPRLKKNLALATPPPTPAPRVHKIGVKDRFFVVENAMTGSYRTVTATLLFITPHAYAWVEDGMQFDQAALQKSTEFFENTVYPTDHKYFGTETVGIDGDVHIHILNTKFGDAAGYFTDEDFFPRTISQYSNQRNMIYMNIEAVKLNTDGYNGDLAHEFQHLLHAYQEHAATTWIDEGMGDLAIKVNGFPVGGVLRVFAENPDTQLDAWSNIPNDTLAHYAGSYLFFDYLAGRFGPDFTHQIILAPRESIYGVQAVLDQRYGGIRFQDLFADWAVTNYLNDPKIENGKYAYNNENFKITSEAKLSQYPHASTVQMHEYAAEYFSLAPAGSDVTIYFTGTTTAKLIGADAHSGNWMWYSNRGDLADTTLTRAVDLSRVTKATLNFWTWYDLEKNFDYGYVEVSTDGGKTWDILPGKTTTTENPNGASYGPAFTGKSGTNDDNSPPQWVQEQMNLSPYAGKQVLLRFEYIDDEAVNLPGWAVDDIAIPEINFSDDVEGGVNGWDAKGFVRTDNVLPQTYIVQVVECCNPTHVVRMNLDAQNRGSLPLDNFGKGIQSAELIVTPFAPVTTEETQFQYAVVPK